MEFLFLFLSQEKTVRVRATALRCLHLIFNKGVCHLSVSPNLVKALFSTLDEHELPTSMRCEALRILRKVVCMFLSIIDELVHAVKLKIYKFTCNICRCFCVCNPTQLLIVLISISCQLSLRMYPHLQSDQ